MPSVNVAFVNRPLIAASPETTMTVFRLLSGAASPRLPSRHTFCAVRPIVVPNFATTPIAPNKGSSR
jgi:hypothetical protein